MFTKTMILMWTTPTTTMASGQNLPPPPRRPQEARNLPEPAGPKQGPPRGRGRVRRPGGGRVSRARTHAQADGDTRGG